MYPPNERRGAVTRTPGGITHTHDLPAKADVTALVTLLPCVKGGCLLPTYVKLEDINSPCPSAIQAVLDLIVSIL